MAEEERSLQLRAQRTRRQLLAAARLVFAQKGYDGATVDDVCEAAGCSKGAYYFHFESKEAALATLLDTWIIERTRALAAALRRPEADGWRDVLLALCEEGEPWEPRLLLEFWAQGARSERVGRRLQQAERAWRRLLAQRLRVASEARTAPAAFVQELAAAALALSAGITVQAALGEGQMERDQDGTGALLQLLAGGEALRRAG